VLKKGHPVFLGKEVGIKTAKSRGYPEYTPPEEPAAGRTFVKLGD
jgi:hypothetical protein